MIKIKNLYIKKPKELLQSCILNIHRGAVTGILGKSGCGKTTVLQEIALLGNHQFNQYSFDDLRVDLLSSSKKNEFIKENICFIMQDIYLFENLTISEILSLYGKFNNKELIDEDKYRMMEYVNLSLDLHTPVSILSGGEKQRLCIACGLLKDAQLYIFDEPFAYLDRSNAQSMFDIIKKIAHERNKYVLVATHDQEISSSLDMIYTFEDTLLTLTKDYNITQDYQIDYNDRKNTDALKYYLELYFKNNKLKMIVQSLSLALMFSMLVIVNQYNDNFQKMHGKSLLSIMENQLIVQREGALKLQPHHITQLSEQYDDYEIYIPIQRDGMQEDFLIGYKSHQEETYDIYKEINNKALINNEIIDDDIYISYEAYRLLEDNKYMFYDLDLLSLDITPTKVLMPSVHNGKALFVPYEVINNLLIEKDIDITYLNHAFVYIPISSISDIDEIQKRLPIGFEIWMEDSLIKSKDIAAVFDKQYVQIFMMIVLIGIIFYKIYDITKIRNDVILFKINGISVSDIIKMKAIQEIYLLCTNILISSLMILVSSIILEVFMFSSYFNMIFIIVIMNIVFYIFILTIYSIVVKTSKVSKLLRTI